jgi:hypothetical protein
MLKAFSSTAPDFNPGLPLAWQALMTSLGAILIMVIVFAVLSSLGIDLSF